MKEAKSRSTATSIRTDPLGSSVASTTLADVASSPVLPLTYCHAMAAESRLSAALAFCPIQAPLIGQC